MSKLEQDKISKLEKQFKNKELTQEEYIEKYQNILDIFGKYMHHDLIRVSKCEHWIYLEQTELLNNLVEQILN